MIALAVRYVPINNLVVLGVPWYVRSAATLSVRVRPLTANLC